LWVVQEKVNSASLIKLLLIRNLHGRNRKKNGSGGSVQDSNDGEKILHQDVSRKGVSLKAVGKTKDSKGVPGKKTRGLPSSQQVHEEARSLARRGRLRRSERGVRVLGGVC